MIEETMERPQMRRTRPQFLFLNSVVNPLEISVQNSLLFVLIALGLLATAASCPSDCICKWKGGKQTVECVNRGLSTFPSPIDSGTQVLDLSGNSFVTLPQDHFVRQGLTNLQKIYLSRCRLTHISSKAFSGLTNLVELDLSNNLLREVPSASLSDCFGLMKLILNGNMISKIPRAAFLGLDSLTTLEMSLCGIEIIEMGALDDLSSLEWLKLNGNKLKNMNAKGVLPFTLKGISLEENPWECDCHLIDLRIWLGERNVANSAEPRCLTPDRLKNATLKELSIDNFACLPQLSPTSTYQKIGEGKNVTFICKISAIPEASVEWLFKGETVSANFSNMLIDTYYPPHSSYAYSPPYHQASASTATSTSEKKSELSILNVTVDENGTYICLARNRAGLAMANFTIKVLSREDPELSQSSVISLSENVTSLVNNYPNLVIIIVSGIAVIGFVITLCFVIACICRCSRACRCRRARSSPRSSSTEAGLRGKAITDEKELGNNKECNTIGLGTGDKHGQHGGVGGGRLVSEERNGQRVGNAQVKANGTVFLLSGSADLGDSNPDLIEGVKRAEGDGHECYSHNHNGQGSAYRGNQSNNHHHNSPNSRHLHGHHQVLPPHPSPRTQASSPSVNPSAEPFNYPMDYGLPSRGALNVSTLPLIRRSNNANNTTIPPNYDLAKYPKEYITHSPVRNSNTGQTYYESDGTSVIYTSHPSTSHISFPPPPPHYITGPHHTYGMYQGEGGMEYGMSRWGHPSLHEGGLLGGSNVSGGCACAPILEQCEEDEENISAPLNCESTYSPKSKDINLNGNSTLTKKIHNKSTGTNPPPVAVRGAQRQLCSNKSSQVHESTDEGYEDGSAEGTEI